MKNRFTAFIGARDWPIWLGLVVTVLWIGASTWYGLAFGPGSPGGLSLDALGSFLDVVFAPLAFLWLVLRRLRLLQRRCCRRRFAFQDFLV